MAKKALPKDQIVKLIVGAGQASPSPPVGPALGSKGVKSMDFCKVRRWFRSTRSLRACLLRRYLGVEDMSPLAITHLSRPPIGLQTRVSKERILPSQHFPLL